MIKPGDVVTVKTTDEPVFVLELKNEEPAHEGFSGVVVLVKRPLLTQNGVDYKVHEFLLEELTTSEERLAKKAEELEDIKRQFMSGGQEETPTFMA